MILRYMRILVFFDLPVVSKKDRKIYSQFRKFLLQDGYDMLQFSVYSRICKGLDGVEKHLSRLEYGVPKKGSVRSLLVTDRQYGAMNILCGKKTAQERKISNDQLIIF